MHVVEEIFVQKFWRMISMSLKLISICSTVNKELQGIHSGIFIIEER